MLRRLSFIATIATVPALATAGEYCVACNGPAATYRCEIDAAAGRDPATTDPRQQLLCITELAKAGGHASCSVERGDTGTCPGPLRTIAAPHEEPDATPLPTPAPRAQTVQPTAPAPAATGPRTVEELARQTTETSKQGLKQAGDAVVDTAQQAGTAVTDTAKTAGSVLGKAGLAVGDAAKKTWGCLASLFKNC
jgi:hypothetical protein